MKIPKYERRKPGPATPVRSVRRHWWGVVRDVSGAVQIVRRGAGTLIERGPGTISATRAGAHVTTTTLQALPDSTLRWLAASSVGLGAGFYLAGAPRLVVAAGIAPALIVGAAMVLRPTEPHDPA